jgi:hypothetical protein
MCIGDIIKFIKLYCNEKSYINNGSYNYTDINEVNNFGFLMSKQLETIFKENCNIILYTGKIIYVYIFDKYFICKIEKTSLKGRYRWFVNTEDYELFIDV